MMRQHPKTVGAPLAQTGLLQQRKNPTHGVVAGAANNALPCVGAPLAQTPSRAHPLSPAMRHQCSACGDALLTHRWSGCRPIGTELHARAILPVPTLEVRKTRAHAPASIHAHARQRPRGLSSSYFSLIDSDPAASVACSVRATHCDQQSASLLPCDANIVVFSRLFAIAGLIVRCWEDHGKPGHDGGLRSDRISGPLCTFRSIAKPRLLSKPVIGAKCMGLPGIKGGCRWGYPRRRLRPGTSICPIPSRRPVQNFGRSCSEKVGWPAKPAALTQGSRGIRQIDLATTREREGAKTHRRAVSESRRGMSP